MLAVVVAAGTVLAEPREPHVAGKFYPAERGELLDLVTELLERQPAPVATQKPRVLISPHAGYPYSGLIAANAFRQVEGQHYDGVVVVGFTHRLQFDGASVDTHEEYQTPLGTIPVDLDAVQYLQTHAGVRYREEPHATEEHSLEVMLPFLQVALKQCKLVPILIGDLSYDSAKALAEALADLAKRGDYLFVFSTDLSHYHPYDDAVQRDERTVNAILSETPQAVYRLFAGAQLEACGIGPITTSLLLSAKLGYLKPVLLTYANSGDTAGDRSSVVGYAAIAMYHQPAASSDMVSPQAGQALVASARQTLDHWYAHQEPLDSSLDKLGTRSGRMPSGVEAEVLKPEVLARYPELATAHGVFVTLRQQGQLRGCIGRIQTNEPLTVTLPLVALDAALRDSRFPPVTAAELANLHLEVSVLTPPQKINDPKELVPGRDGVLLDFQGHQGVFLPQVWEETGWTREEFLRELASQKAGLPPDAWQHATLYTFQAQVFEEEPLPAAASPH